MANLAVNVAGVSFKNPIIPASGVFGYGREYEKLFPLSELGGIATKGTTGQPRPGNPAPRIAETPSGMLNSVGLQNPGIDAFLERELPNLLTKDTVILANIAGSTVEECVSIAEKLDETDVHMIELNISCPNVKNGGMAFGTDAKMAAQVCQTVKAHTTKPVIMKLSPNVTDVVEIALQWNLPVPTAFPSSIPFWACGSISKIAARFCGTTSAACLALRFFPLLYVWYGRSHRQFPFR